MLLGKVIGPIMACMGEIGEGEHPWGGEFVQQSVQRELNDVKFGSTKHQAWADALQVYQLGHDLSDTQDALNKDTYKSRLLESELRILETRRALIGFDIEKKKVTISGYDNEYRIADIEIAMCIDTIGDLARDEWENAETTPYNSSYPIRDPRVKRFLKETREYISESAIQKRLPLR